MAILAGDAMMSAAFSLICGMETATPQAVRDLVRELAAATTAMISGQVYDTLGGFPAGMDERRQLDLVHRKKTGALIRAACRMGGICGEADDAAMGHLSRYGDLIGLMFQIVDDLLDVTQSTEHIGKTTGKDQSAGKLTFPGLLGIEPSYAEIRRLESEAMASLESLPKAADPLRDLCHFLAVRTR
jgi:geranylgeranyl diphosphate synthase type II